LRSSKLAIAQRALAATSATPRSSRSPLAAPRAATAAARPRAAVGIAQRPFVGREVIDQLGEDGAAGKHAALSAG
jgi:hypothetical protein